MLDKSPFTNDYNVTENYVDFVRDITNTMNTDDVKQVSIGDASPAKFRMTLKYLGDKSGKKFTTKTDKNKRMWLKRIK